MDTREKHNQRKEKKKKPYNSPEIKVYGTVEKLTGWFGGPWGEFLCGPISGWNPGGGEGS